MAIKTYTFSLQQAYKLTSSVKHFVLYNKSNELFNYLPGQFITLHIEKDNKIYRRSYSIANPPSSNNIIEFAAAYYEGGIASEFLFNLKPDEDILISGPFGRLVLKDKIPKKYVLAATSTGVTPYRSMLPKLQELLKADDALEIIILLGVRSKNDKLYAEDFLKFSASNARAKFYIHYSQNERDLSAHERLGYLQKAFSDLQLNGQEDYVYLCGNPKMIDETFDLLLKQGFDIHNIVREKYIPSK